MTSQDQTQATQPQAPQEQQQPQAAQAYASAPQGHEAAVSNYVALRPLRFGETIVQPGQRVPLDSFRDYAKMLKEGSIAIAADPAGVAAAQLSTGTAGLPQVAQHPQRTNAKQFIELTAGPAYFVSQDGAASRVMVLSFHSPEAEDMAELGIEPGGAVAEVTFEGDSPTEAPSRVNAGSLLPVQPTQRLIEDMQAAADQEPPQAPAQAEADPAAAAALAELRQDLDFKTVLIDAMTTEGVELPDYLTTHTKGVLTKAKITTLEGLVKLASGPEGFSNLVKLNGIAEKSAGVLVNALVSNKALPADSAVAEGE